MVVISVGAVEAVAVVDGQGVEDRLPAVDPAGEVVSSGLVLVGDKVENLERGLFVGEVPSMSDGAPEAGVGLSIALVV